MNRFFYSSEKYKKPIMLYDAVFDCKTCHTRVYFKYSPIPIGGPDIPFFSWLFRENKPTQKEIDTTIYPVYLTCTQGHCHSYE